MCKSIHRLLQNVGHHEGAQLREKHTQNFTGQKLFDQPMD